MLINRNQNLSEKENSNGTSSAPFCDGKYNSKNNDTSKDITCGCQRKIETKQSC